MHPLFNNAVYQNRRTKLMNTINSGIALFVGNNEASMNFPSNPYRYRQDSNFIYFFGLWVANLAAIIDFDEKNVILFGDDFDIDDIIWMGNQPSIKALGEKSGINNVQPYSKLADYIKSAQDKGRKIHFTPPYRGCNKILISNLTGINVNEVRNATSLELIKAIVDLRSTKEAVEIEEMEKACEYGVLMHTAIMKRCVAGVSELELAGIAEGISLSYGNGVSFPVILSQHGETLHNHIHNGILEKDKMLLVDAGVESTMGYASDYTRTLPVGGKFTSKQKEIYEIVLSANLKSIDAIKPSIYYKEIHRMAAEIIVEGLKNIGLMKGDTQESVELGAHALFFPHGLGHQLGLDVHDMEDLGENYVGYDNTVQRSSSFGWNALRMARKLEKGFIITVEPGIYFIPQLIDIWKNENKFSNFINYNKVEEYRNFGGIRIEDDVLTTETSHKVLGPHLAKTVCELENIIGK